MSLKCSLKSPNRQPSEWEDMRGLCVHVHVGGLCMSMHVRVWCVHLCGVYVYTCACVCMCVTNDGKPSEVTHDFVTFLSL